MANRAYTERYSPYINAIMTNLFWLMEKQKKLEKECKQLMGKGSVSYYINQLHELITVMQEIDYLRDELKELEQ